MQNYANNTGFCLSNIRGARLESSNVIERLTVRNNNKLQENATLSFIKETQVNYNQFQPTLLNSESTYHKNATSRYTQNPLIYEINNNKYCNVQSKLATTQQISLLECKNKFKAINTNNFCQMKLYDLTDQEFYERLRNDDQELVTQIKMVGNGNFMTGLNQIENTKIYLEKRQKLIKKSKQKLEL